MNENEAFVLVKKIIEKTIFPGDCLYVFMDADLRNDLGLDSLDQITLVLNIEKELRIVFAEDDSYQRLSVRDLVEWIVHSTAK